jgi:hypothetical protein
MFFITAGLSPPPEPYNPEADPVMKEAQIFVCILM